MPSEVRYATIVVIASPYGTLVPAVSFVRPIPTAYSVNALPAHAVALSMQAAGDRLVVSCSAKVDWENRARRTGSL